MSTFSNASLLVTGASGNLGRIAVEELLARGATKVIAGTRDPSRLADLAAKGVEVELARADLGEKGVWHRVLFGRFATGAQALAAKDSSPEGLDLDQSVPVRREGVVEKSSAPRLAEVARSI